MFRTIPEDGFCRTLLSIVLPITIQSLINSAVNSADVFMLGFVGQSQLSAVSLANQLQFLNTGFFWGVTSGTALIVAQYWGKGDRRSIQIVMGIGLKISLIFTALLTLAAVWVPDRIMSIFTDEAKLISIGASYLRAIGISYMLQSLSQIYECGMRSMGRAAASAAISAFALLMNVALNALFIFGWLGFPRLGVLGVAAATVIARVAETLLCVLHALLTRKDFIRYEWRLVMGRHPDLLRDFLHYSLPALLNDISWTAAFSTYSIILGHLGDDAVASAAVATTVRDLCTVVCMSLGQAAVAIVGREIGAGLVEDARRDGRRITVLSLILGAVTGGIVLLLRPLILAVFPLTPAARDYLSFMLLVSSYYVIGQSVNTTLIAGVFRAGGDTRFGMLCDTVNMWCIAVPLGFFAAFVLKWPLKAVYVVLCLDEFYKIPAEYVHYKKYGWLQNVTREPEAVK